MRYITTVAAPASADAEGEKKYVIDINSSGEVTIDNDKRTLDLQAIDDDGLYSLLINNRSFEAMVEEGDGEYRVLINGTLYTVQVVDERAQRLAEAAGAFTSSGGEVNLKSPMPGLIVAIPVNVGDAVTKGQVVLVLESMKMENELKSPRNGVIGTIKVQPKQAVEQGQVLLTIGE
jgi:biotin carboxyl carrier protein